jgi:DNA-binding CsgD family transcriptional regulator/sugar-specific transcriptional regulator TrmB
MTLRDLGFSVDQERVYRAVLADPSADLVTIAARTSLTDEAVINALDALAEIQVLRIETSGVTVPDPGLTLGRLIEEQEDDLLSRYRRVSGTRSEVAQLQAGFTKPQPGPEPDIERVEGVGAVRERIAELAFFARVSVDAIQPGGAQSAAALEASRPLDLRAVRRKISMRVIHESPVLDDELNRVHLRELVMLGVSARVSDPPLGRMLILDREVAVLPMDPRDSRRGALIVRNPGLVVGLQDLFDRTWSAAQELPWTTEPEPAPEDITASDRQVLSMLASGCTDETVAREIGVSVRHLRRRIARLMIVLGARSRFEAGVEAAGRGWI